MSTLNPLARVLFYLVGLARQLGEIGVSSRHQIYELFVAHIVAGDACINKRGLFVHSRSLHKAPHRCPCPLGRPSSEAAPLPMAAVPHDCSLRGSASWASAAELHHQAAIPLSHPAYLHSVFHRAVASLFDFHPTWTCSLQEEPPSCCPSVLKRHVSESLPFLCNA